MHMFEIGAYLAELKKISNPFVIPRIITEKSLTNTREPVDHVFPFYALWLRLGM